MKKILTILALFICELSVSGQITGYKNLLTQYSLYSSTEYNLPSFSYPSKTSTELKTFMLKYRIDSIAGNYDEFQRQVNLLKWVNRTFKHCGNTPVPSKLNADTLAIIGQKSGVHCGGLAIILNAAYLSLGFKSRFITCLNNDTTFNDPHTLTIVFSNKFKKWIMFDPTYCAYFIGNEDIPLSVEDIRAGLATNSNIKLNCEFNLNSVSTTAGSKNDYLEYLTRNMFRFISPVSIEYNWNMDCLDYINLIPKGYILGSIPLGNVIVDGCSKIYCIDNQKQFWEE